MGCCAKTGLSCLNPSKWVTAKNVGVLSGVILTVSVVALLILLLHAKYPQYSLVYYLTLGGTALGSFTILIVAAVKAWCTQNNEVPYRSSNQQFEDLSTTNPFDKEV